MKAFFNNAMFNRFLGVFVFLMVLTSFGCNHDLSTQNSDETNDSIVIKHIKIDDRLCGNNDVVEVFESEANLEIEFEKIYKDLSVKIDNNPVSVLNKIITHRISNITEFKKTIEIEIIAKKKSEKIKIGVRKPLPTEIKIDKIVLGTSLCHHNSNVVINESKAMLTVEVLEKYTNLAIKVNDTHCTVMGKTANLLIEDITETPKTILVLLTASGKVDKTVQFNVSKKTAEASAIVISRVLIDDIPCIKDKIVECKSSSPKLTVEFMESYEGLNVKVNEGNADVSSNRATYSFTGITEDKINV